jgi:hypothetical protein
MTKITIPYKPTPGECSTEEASRIIRLFKKSCAEPGKLLLMVTRYPESHEDEWGETRYDDDYETESGYFGRIKHVNDKEGHRYNIDLSDPVISIERKTLDVGGYNYPIIEECESCVSLGRPLRVYCSKDLDALTETLTTEPQDMFYREVLINTRISFSPESSFFVGEDGDW